MANEVSPNIVPSYLLGGTIDVEVTGPLVGRSIFDGLRRKFSTSGQMEKGDYLMDRSRELLRRHLQLIELEEQVAIRKKFDELVIPSTCRSLLVDCGATVCEMSKMASKVSAGQYWKSTARPGNIDVTLR